MRALFYIIVCLFVLPAFAKTSAKPSVSLRDPSPKPNAHCRLNYDDELKSARVLATKSKFAVYPIEGSDVDKFLGAFNATEPKTNFQANEILIAVGPSFAYVELFSGGCIDHEGKLEPAAFDALMNEAFGDDLPGALAM